MLDRPLWGRLQPLAWRLAKTATSQLPLLIDLGITAVTAIGRLKPNCRYRAVAVIAEELINADPI